MAYTITIFLLLTAGLGWTSPAKAQGLTVNTAASSAVQLGVTVVDSITVHLYGQTVTLLAQDLLLAQQQLIHMTEVDSLLSAHAQDIRHYDSWVQQLQRDMNVLDLAYQSARQRAWVDSARADRIGLEMDRYVAQLAPTDSIAIATLKADRDSLTAQLDSLSRYRQHIQWVIGFQDSLLIECGVVVSRQGD